MASRIIRSLPVSGSVSRTKVRAAVKAARTSSKPSTVVVSKTNPIKSKQTASGKKLISFRVAKVG